MKVILFQPQIPQNTGNIVRTCSVTGSSLILVKPLGFSVSHKKLKRAGLDYWEEVDISIIDDLVSYLESLEHPFYFFSSHAQKAHSDIPFTLDAHLIFGSETTGLPAIFREKWPELFYTLPMKSDARCLNLANTVSIVLYEGLRQHNYKFPL
jgi:tRNA (cytidine/uridine-2'-O-)-methyltransferase